ncbi:MAG: polymer-forming cytoskeletal protein [Tistlia sp.]|uniref:polymer-forming cytoskeletal protein n=1 Tax=Tistlia sp. TaxID=3057121 RepID=UPI0034A1F19C
MFGRRKSGSGDDRNDSPAETTTREAGAVRSSRPDAAAVLERQPTPPIREPLRRPTQESRSVPSKHTEETEGKKLTVGKGIRLSGEITACEKLVVEGQVEADLSGAQDLVVAESGLFKGRAIVDRAEISGTFEGELTVREVLSLHGSGLIEGTLRFAEMEIQRGGRVRGTIEELNSADSAKPSGPKAVDSAPLGSPVGTTPRESDKEQATAKPEVAAN